MQNYIATERATSRFNVQTICNSNLEITDTVARWPGSSHDSTIFNNSCIKAEFESGYYGNALLLEDGGYASTSYTMTPLDNPRTPVEQLYNESQIRTRNTVERSYGIWKRRFPVLAIGLQTKLNKSDYYCSHCRVAQYVEAARRSCST